MKRLRNLCFAALLALALIVGQQAVALHELGHAATKVSQEPGAPSGSSSCDTHFLFTQLSGAVGAFASVPAASAGEVVAALVSQAFAPAAARLAFHSRAPPTIL